MDESEHLPEGLLKCACLISNLEALPRPSSSAPLSSSFRYCVEFGLRVGSRSRWWQGGEGTEEDGAYLGRINVSTDLP